MAPRRSSLSPAKKALEKINKVRSEQQQQRQQHQNDQGEAFSGTDLPELAILRISEPIVALSSDLFDNSNNGSGNELPSKRASDASSAEALDAPTTPASLEADLTHYKELFSKLRFSYLEQVTKEKFLRAIVGDPPMVVGHNENIELEAELAKAKQQLKQRKEDVRFQVEEMEKTARDLARRYKQVQLQKTQLSELPASIENLESTIASLREAQSTHATNASFSDPHNSSPSQNLPLPATLSLLAEREAELAALERQLATVQNTQPRKTREAEAMERELAVLERRKGEAIAQAQEAKRKKLEGETDGLEEMGRWYRGAEQILKQLVEI